MKIKRLPEDDKIKDYVGSLHRYRNTQAFVIVTAMAAAVILFILIPLAEIPLYIISGINFIIVAVIVPLQFLGAMRHMYLRIQELEKQQTASEVIEDKNS